jgi:Nitrosopumilus output domain 1
MDDEKYYTCFMTFDQYMNFKNLPIVRECNVLKKNPEDYDDYVKEMQKAIDLAVKNDTSHIRRLSENVG